MNEKSGKGIILLAGAVGVGIIYFIYSLRKKTGLKVLVTQAFASISSYLTRAWVMRGSTWYMYDPADLIGSDLTYVQEGEYIQISVTQNCTLTYGTKSWPLTSGWNTITWQTT